MKIAERLLATICFLLAFPAAFLKLPWIVPTALEFSERFREVVHPDGTESHMQYVHDRFTSLTLALLLYVLGSVAFFGFPVVMATRCQRPLSLVIWSCALIAGIGLPVFERGGIISQTDRFYVASVVHLPSSIAALSLIGILCWLYSSRCHSRVEPIASSGTGTSPS